ncbi:S-adenosyl-L-methionine-dependent methyltransferase [Rhexocercosporidium sp. MPI-PUGE-AT-0058]|nr:S-adenosyl-L-methionine-dependent methyltransferase [Rhexocercosporidium sp. MPI-PUGE-AT-0058]
MPPHVEQKPGFSTPDFSWDEYIRYRPSYPSSFWNHIYSYHSSHSGHFGVAHDDGAGAGIASQDLALKFEKIIVSDPNDNYANIASSRLITQFGYPSSKFTFLQERGESSSVESATVDLLVVCEAIHWMDIDAVMGEFARKVKPDGTLAISHYGWPVMVGNDAAQRVWNRMFDVWEEKNFYRDEVRTRTIKNGVTGLDVVPFSMDDWKEGARHPFPSRVGEKDVKEWIENDGDWIDEKAVQWLKGFFASFIPTVPKDEIRELWDNMEEAVGRGNKVKFAWPVVQLLATRRQ